MNGSEVVSVRSVSVVICTWNRCELLAETLASLAQQCVPREVRVEVVVVDNNSTDRTRAVVEEFQQSWTCGELRYLHEPRQGKQFALNAGIRNSAGEILAFTDDDVVFDESWLHGVVELFQDTSLELAGGKTLIIWPDGRPPRWFQPSMLAVVAGVDIGDERMRPPPPDYAPAGTNLIARRTLFDRIGAFSETHVRHMDYEFGMRAMRKHAIIEYDPRLVVYTKVPAGILQQSYFRRWYFKLGIAQSMQARQPVPYLFGVPRWVWRRLASDALYVGLQRLRGRGERVFDCELRAVQLWGMVAATWHRKWFPGEHQSWVDRWSQKRGTSFI